MSTQNETEEKKDKKKAVLEWGAYIIFLVAVFIVFHFFLMLGRNMGIL